MAFNFSDAPVQRQDGVIPDGTFVKLHGHINPGKYTLPGNEFDFGLFRESKTSSAIMLDWEFTVIYGPHANRKFYQFMTVAGGNLTPEGVSKGWLVTRVAIRAIIESAAGLRPDDMSPATQQKREVQGFRQLDHIEFAAILGVEFGNDGYSDKNKIRHIVTPDEKEWQAVMAGQEVEPRPSSSKGRAAPNKTAEALAARLKEPQTPNWAQQKPQAQAATEASAPSWQQSGVPEWVNS